MAGFPQTHWSLLLVGDSDSDAHLRAFSHLAEAYYDPILSFVRRQGHEEDAARDLTQAFLAELLEKRMLDSATPERGRFRSFVAVCLRNFLHDQHARASARRRAPVKPIESLQRSTPDGAFELDIPSDSSPEREFELRWAQSLVRRAAGRMRSELDAKGLAGRFDALLEQILGESGRPYAELASELGMSESAIKMTVVRWRRRLGRALREEVAATVATPDLVDDELRHLLEVYGSAA